MDEKIENTIEEPKQKIDPLEDDAIQKCIGGFGWYQIMIVLCLVPCKIPTSLHSLGIVFLAPPMDFICLDNNNTDDALNKCPCTNPSYLNDQFEETIVTTWDLICDKAWLVSFTQTILMLGILVGSVIFGALADRFGRRYPLSFCVLLELVAGIGASFSPIFWLFLVLRFLIGAAVGGIYVTSFVLLLEFTGKRYRELASSLTQVPFNAGYVLLPILGYYFRKWQEVQFLFSIWAAGLVVVFWFLPESPRWLLTVRRTEEAIAVLERAARMNNRPTENIAEVVKKYQSEKSSEVASKGTLFDLFRTPNIRKNTIFMSVNWIVCSFGFFGVSQYIGRLSGNIFLNNAVSALLNVAATFAIFFMAKYMKRRPSLLILHIGTAVCLIAIAAIPESGAIARVILAGIGDLGMFVAFIIVYVYATELFPTIIRNAALGVFSMMARVGSMIAPFVVTLESTAEWLPSVLFGIAPLIAAILVVFMPESKGCDVMNTVEEGERFGRKSNSKINANISNEST